MHLQTVSNDKTFSQMMVISPTAPETMVSSSQLAVYLRRWSPGRYELGPFEEVIISEHTVEQLKTKVRDEICAQYG